MGIGLVIRPLALAGLVAAVAGLALPARAAECPTPALPATAPADPARPLPLHQILALPNQPDAGLENSRVATIGYVVRVRRLAAAAAPCPADGPAWRLWLSTREPYGLKGLVSRHRAVVASVPASRVAELAGGPRALEKLVGRRIWISGQMAFNPTRRDEMMHTRGTLWEVRSLTAVARCPSPSCTLAKPPSAKPTPAEKHKDKHKPPTRR